MLVRRSSNLRPHTVPRVVQRAARHLECNATAAVAIPPIPAPQQRIHARTNPHAACMPPASVCLAFASPLPRSALTLLCPQSLRLALANAHASDCTAFPIQCSDRLECSAARSRKSETAAVTL